jgi:hypothetical protein
MQRRELRKKKSVILRGCLIWQQYIKWEKN